MNTKVKRKHKRKPTQVLLNIELLSDATHETSTRAVIQNISSGGANINCDEEFNTGDEIGMKFILPNESVYFFKASIVRSAKLTMIYSYGIQFSPMGMLDRIKLWRLISKIAIG